MATTRNGFKRKPLGDDVEIVPLKEPKIGQGGYVGFHPHSEVLPKGWKYDHPGAKPLVCDVLAEHDVGIKMRDGAMLYADIYRPANSSEKVPAILCWSPFGKKFNGLMSLDLMVPWKLGIPDGTLSGLEKFEAPDPNDWVPRGYAIVNIDIRGSGDSDGVMAILGAQEGEDGYDTIEELAKMPWCDGVALAGNSHLAIAQWFIASQQPPSLKAIAPWEGCGDLYREQFSRGGIYSGDLFDRLIMGYMLQGKHGVENIRGYFEKHPTADDFWNDKRPDMTKINVPTYITGTWTNTMHGIGAIRAWLQVSSKQKWLRWHPWQEWYDIWGNLQAKEELFSFMDYFCKGAHNGWDTTPKCRMGVLRFGNKIPQSYENVIVEDFPLPQTDYKKAYLAEDGILSLDTVPKAGTVSYNSESADTVTFTYKFDKTTQLVGLPKAVLYMSCPDHNDMDIYIQIQKLDANGEQMTNLNIPWKGIPVSTFEEFKKEQATEVVQYRGPLGILRASYRAIDESKSMHPHWPFHPHDKQEKVAPGEIVRLDIGIWAFGIEYEAGESLRVAISGRTLAVDNFGTLDHLDNKGEHVVHLGGEHASHVVLPFT